MAFEGDVVFTHFTDATGVEGITGLDAPSLSSGESAVVNELRFGMGANSYAAQQAGDIFVTDLGANASSLQLSQIGVFGARQSYAISFSGQEAAAQGVYIRGSGLNNIYTLPGGSTLNGFFTVLCR